MSKKKWIAYGTTGALGLSLFAGGAVVAANAMELRTSEGAALPGGVITDREAPLLDLPAAQRTVVDSSVSVVSVPSPATVGSSPSVVSAPTPAAADVALSVPSAPSPATPDSPVSPQSPDSPASPLSPASAPSPNSPASVPSPPSL